MSALDPLLSSQLSLLGVDSPQEAPTREAWTHVLSWVSEHYREMDEERKLLRESLELRLHELVERLARERGKHDCLRDSLRAAGAVQRSWAPPHGATIYPGVCVAGHFEAAHECGGDWWASYELDDERVLVVIGDVTGHGPDAALLTGVAKGACDLLVRSAYPRSTLTPPAILRVLSRSIYDAAPQGMTMTCSVGVLDQHSGTVTIASAGHPLPYIVREAGALDHIQAKGPSLGSQPRTWYDETTALLSDGDMVLWYTDGLVEAEDRKRRQFGHRRLRQLLCNTNHDDPVSLRDAIRDQLASFRGESSATDDVAFVVAQRRCG